MSEQMERPTPLMARIHLAHAVVQKLADDGGIDLLHLKGPAVLPGLRAATKSSSDVDVLVRPSHLAALVEAMEAVGFEQRTDFSTGSVFAHAANWWHNDWGWVDVHTSWPGVLLDAEKAYEVFARDQIAWEIAHWPCAVPDRIAQRLILILHAARSPENTADLELSWTGADEDERAAVRRLAAELDAEVALAAGIGELDLHRGARTYLLWRYFTEGGSRLDEWRARLAAAATAREKVELLASALRVNRDHLRMELGHAPSRSEVRARQLSRIRLGATEVTRRVTRRPRDR